MNLLDKVKENPKQILAKLVTNDSMLHKHHMLAL